MFVGAGIEASRPDPSDSKSARTASDIGTAAGAADLGRALREAGSHRSRQGERVDRVTRSTHASSAGSGGSWVDLSVLGELTSRRSVLEVERHKPGMG